MIDGPTAVYIYWCPAPSGQDKEDDHGNRSVYSHIERGLKDEKEIKLLGSKEMWPRAWRR